MQFVKISLESRSKHFIATFSGQLHFGITSSKQQLFVREAISSEQLLSHSGLFFSAVIFSE